LDGRVRRLLILASAMVFLDVAFMSAIAPLLPSYVDDLGLSKAQAGILSAAYAAGTLVAALPAGYVAGRIGPRRTVIVGLALIGGASVVFGLVDEFDALVAARLVQGAAGALVWSGALTWLVTSAPEENRGSLIGSVLGIAITGALLGPALGAAAGSIGTGPAFSAILVISVVLIYFSWSVPDTTPPDTQPLGDVFRTLISRPVLDASLFVVAPSLMFGAVDVIVPLRINALGGGHVVIAAGFIGGAAVEAVLAPIAGRTSDRIGRRAPYALGLAICAVSMVAVAVAGSLAGVIGGLILTSIGAGLCFAPAMTVIADIAEASELHQGYAAGLSNIGWAAGQVLGGIGGGVIAEFTGNAATGIAIAVLLALVVIYALRTIEAAPAPGVPA
jgi:MFS family permease